MKTNCGENPCGCGRIIFGIGNKTAALKYQSFAGRKHAVVPVILARADVVMNEGRVPEKELFAPAWNGVPVTISHPRNKESDEFISANSPKTLEEWCVGRIFNAAVEDGVLKGEAWVDVENANEKRPGLIDEMKKGIDVSTGYFCDVTEEKGELNGRAYTHVQTNLKPDHLALLPDEVGACSREDGCGVGLNKRMTIVNLKEALAVLTAHLTKSEKPKKNADENAKRKMIADLIGMEESPFSEDDEKAMASMSDAALSALASKFLGAKGNEEEEAEEEVKEPEEKKEPVAEKKGNALSADDLATIETAREIVNERRTDLISRIVTAGLATEAEAKEMDLKVLNTLAKAAAPAADFAGRALPSSRSNATKEVVEAMTSPSLDEVIRNKRKAA
jgi:hypothetical protein